MENVKKKCNFIHCLGLSASHANDENVGATLPDITFERDEVPEMPHEAHDTKCGAIQVSIASGLHGLP